MTAEEFPATWDGGHALIVEFGDEQLLARCQCGVPFGQVFQVVCTATPMASLDSLGIAWERHVMTRDQPLPPGQAIRRGKRTR